MVYRIFTGDFPITATIYLFMLLWAAHRRSLIRDLMAGDTPIWNRIGQMTLGAAAVAPLWIAAADNWRQLLGYSYSAKDRWQSDPYTTMATPDALRVISLVLLGIIVVGVALLYARRRGPFVSMVLAAVIATAFFYVFDPLRVRFDALFVGTRATLDSYHVIDIAFTLFYALGIYIVMALLIIAALIVLAAIVAVPAKLIYWLATRGRVEPEAETFTLYRLRAHSMASTTANRSAPRSVESPPSESRSNRS